MKAAIWARVSTDDQNTGNQLDQLRAWAQRRGLEVVQEFVTEDSAWASNSGSNGKGSQFDKARNDLINGARLGHYQVVLIWALDRLSRRGIEDTLNVLRRLAEYEADVWSLQEDWLRTSDPAMRELLVGIFGWMAGQESKRRSERIKAGLARRKAEGKPVGGRQPGSKDRKPRSCEGYKEAWEKRRMAS